METNTGSAQRPAIMVCVYVCVCVCVCVCVNNEKATGVYSLIPSLKTGLVQIGVTYTLVHTHAHTHIVPSDVY